MHIVCRKNKNWRSEKVKLRKRGTAQSKGQGKKPLKEILQTKKTLSYPERGQERKLWKPEKVWLTRLEKLLLSWAKMAKQAEHSIFANRPWGKINSHNALNLRSLSLSLSLIHYRDRKGVLTFLIEILYKWAGLSLKYTVKSVRYWISEFCLAKFSLYI